MSVLTQVLRIGGTGAALAGAAALFTDATTLISQRGDFVIGNQNFKFPSDIKDYHIHFKFQSYQRRSIYEQPFLTPTNGIRLPIPSRLTDNVSVNYDKESLGSAFGAAAEVASQATTSSSAGTALERLQRGAEAVAGGTAGFSAQALQNFAARAGADQALSAASAVTGIAFNPFQTVLFKNPNFKKHSFSWRFVPKSRDESIELENIIRLFKYHMLPGVGVGGVFFTFPEILQIKLYPSDLFLYQFKPCVVESVSVNYAPGGSPSFYGRTQAPTAIDFSVELQEIEIWTKADYQRDQATGRVPEEARGRAPTNLIIPQD